MFDSTVNGGFLPICIPKPLIYLTHTQRSCNNTPTINVTLSFLVLQHTSEKKSCIKGKSDYSTGAANMTNMKILAGEESQKFTTQNISSR